MKLKILPKQNISYINIRGLHTNIPENEPHSQEVKPNFMFLPETGPSQFIPVQEFES